MLFILGILLMPTLSASEPGTTLVITHTWDGVPLPADQHARLTLRLLEESIEITVDAPFHGDPPPPSPPGSFDGLWDYEVVELFIAGAPDPETGGIPYTEIELSPHGHHLVLRLAGVRNPTHQGLPLEFTTSIHGDRWRGTALLPKSYLPKPPWTANAYAIHGIGKERRYLAMIPVPDTKPNFHRPDVFRPLTFESP